MAAWLPPPARSCASSDSARVLDPAVRQPVRQLQRAGPGVPDPERAVVGRRDDPAIVRREAQGHPIIEMVGVVGVLVRGLALERAQEPSGRQVPDAKRVAAASRDRLASVGREGDRVDPLRTAGEHMDRLPPRQVPEPDREVAAARRCQRPAGRPRGTGQLVVALREGACRLAARHLPARETVTPARSQDLAPVGREAKRRDLGRPHPTEALYLGTCACVPDADAGSVAGRNEVAVRRDRHEERRTRVHGDLAAWRVTSGDVPDREATEAAARDQAPAVSRHRERRPGPVGVVEGAHRGTGVRVPQRQLGSRQRQDRMPVGHPDERTDRDVPAGQLGAVRDRPDVEAVVGGASQPGAVGRECDGSDRLLDRAGAQKDAAVDVPELDPVEARGGQEAAVRRKRHRGDRASVTDLRHHREVRRAASLAPRAARHRDHQAQEDRPPHG